MQVRAIFTDFFSIIPYYLSALLAMSFLVGVITFLLPADKFDAGKSLTATCEYFLYNVPLGLISYSAGDLLKQSSDSLAIIVAAVSMLILSGGLMVTLQVEHWWKPLVIFSGGNVAVMLLLGLQ